MAEVGHHLEPNLENAVNVMAKGKQGASTVKIDFRHSSLWSRVKPAAVEEVIDKPCNICDGSGKVRKNKKIKLEIPAGVEDGVTLQMRGEGEPSETEYPGDLLIRIHVKPHPLFERLENGHLLYTLNLNFTDPCTWNRGSSSHTRWE